VAVNFSAEKPLSLELGSGSPPNRLPEKSASGYRAGRGSSISSQEPRMPLPDPTKHAATLFEEFKNFAFKGNVIDLAVGVIIGGAFGKIVSSLVDNIIMPTVSVIMPGDAGYKDWALKVGEKTIPYGAFLGDIVSFLILALALFVFIVKFLGWIMKSKAAEAAAPPAPTKDQELLTEIRDLLKNR
jgi:large conductance mechanosensitive channel